MVCRTWRFPPFVLCGSNYPKSAPRAEGCRLGFVLFFAMVVVVGWSMTTSIRTQLAIVGGGPAGMMHGLLMARAGVDVVVLEKHGDFLRDFRGDTVHPSTLEIIRELGLLEDFLKRPHQKLRE